MVGRQLGDVHEALDAGVDLDERAEGDHLRNLALDDVVDPKPVDDALPRVGLGLLETQGDPLPLTVDVEHLDLDLLPNRQHLGRVVDVAPRELGDVDQAIDALQVDERAEVDDVRNHAFDHVARLKLVEDLLANLAALVLEHGPAREHHIVAIAVQLDDLAFELPAQELIEVLHAPDVDQRCRQESPDAKVQDQPALDDLDHRAFDVLAGRCCGLDALPRLLEARALLGEDQTTILVFFDHHERVDHLAELDFFEDVDRLADRQLGQRDDAFALVPDVDEDLVLVDPDHPTVDHVPFGEDRDRQVVVRNHLPVNFDVFGAVERAHWGVEIYLGHVVFSLTALRRYAGRTKRPADRRKSEYRASGPARRRGMSARPASWPPRDAQRRAAEDAGDDSEGTDHRGDRPGDRRDAGCRRSHGGEAQDGERALAEAHVGDRDECGGRVPKRPHQPGRWRGPRSDDIPRGEDAGKRDGDDLAKQARLEAENPDQHRCQACGHAVDPARAGQRSRSRS